MSRKMLYIAVSSLADYQSVPLFSDDLNAQSDLPLVFF